MDAGAIMSTTQFLQVLLQVPLVIGLAFGALALSLGLALLLGGDACPSTLRWPAGQRSVDETGRVGRNLL